MRSHSKTAITVALVFVLAVGVAAWATSWGPFANDDPEQVSAPTPAPSATITAPATPSEAPVPGPSETTTAPAPAPTPTAGTAPSPTPGSTLAPATVVVTYASWANETSAIEAGAYAAVIEDAGECTLTLTKGVMTRSVSVAASLDVSTTSCGRFLIPGADLTTGTWTAVVTYLSSTSAGQSDPIEVVVP